MNKNSKILLKNVNDRLMNGNSKPMRSSILGMQILKSKVRGYHNFREF